MSYRTEEGISVRLWGAGALKGETGPGGRGEVAGGLEQGGKGLERERGRGLVV